MSSRPINFGKIMRASRDHSRDLARGYRVLINPIMPRDTVFMVIDPVLTSANLLTFWAHPCDALWLLHPHSPVLSRRTLGHRELERDKRRFPKGTTNA